MLVQQQLAACEVCFEGFAVEYQGNHGRLASTVTRIRFFACPSCRHHNPVMVPFSAGPFLVKPVLGPVAAHRVHLNRVRGVWPS